MTGLKLTVPFDPEVAEIMEQISGMVGDRNTRRFNTLDAFICYIVGEHLRETMANDKFYAVPNLPPRIPGDDKPTARFLEIARFYSRWWKAKAHKAGYALVTLTVRETTEPMSTYVMQREANAGRMTLPIRVVDVSVPSEKEDHM